MKNMKKICLIVSLLQLYSVSILAQTYCLKATKISETATTLTVYFSMTSSHPTSLNVDLTLKITGGGGISGLPIPPSGIDPPYYVGGNTNIGGGNSASPLVTALNPTGHYTFAKVSNNPATFTIDETNPLGAFYTIISPPSIVQIFSGCTIDNVVLPLDLRSFTAKKDKTNGDKTLVQWESVGEKNLETYIVERSEDGINFKPIGFERPKAKNETEKVDYSFMDDKPAIGINYYRLQSKELSKKVNYSKIVSVDFGLGIKAKTFPNPFTAELNIEIDIEQGVKGEVTVDMFDTSGKQVLTKKLNAEGRKLNFDIPTEGLVPGSYVIRIKNGSYTWQHKITKQ
jgi:hypothetical protein